MINHNTPLASQERMTYCRICEAHCGLVAQVSEEGKIIDIKPDKQHPVSRGYACIKGVSLGGLHTDPDRINHPLKRVGGQLQRISWAQAIEEIGQKVRELRKQHSDRSIAMYQGNPTFFSFQNILFSSAFLESIDSPNLFASHSVDLNNKYQASTEMYGQSMVHPVPDFDHTQFLMILGSNPVVSQMSVLQIPNALQKLKDIEARGGQVVIVDPRKTETANKLGQHVFIRPGTDVYLLLAMLHVIAHEEQLDTRPAQQHAHGVSQFTDCAKAWTPERAALLTGIEAAKIRALAKAYLASDGAALHMSTGVNMGPFGTLCYWLVQGMNLITGNTDRRGGLLFPRGAFDALKLAQALGLGGFDAHRTLKNNWHRLTGCFPSSALADEINIDHPQRIRALFVSAGNPVHSLPNGAALAQAMGKLDLIVSIDIYPSETTQYAHYILPATDMLERSDFPASHMVLQDTPHAQYTEAVVPPLYERRPEWQIFSDLALACGAPWSLQSICNNVPHLNRLLKKMPLLGSRLSAYPIDPDRILALLLRWGKRTDLATLRKAPRGVLLGATPAGSFLGHRVPTPDGKVQLWPHNLTRDLQRLELLQHSFKPAPDKLLLIGQRQRRMHNSWMLNNPEMPATSGMSALLHPDDAQSRSIAAGDEIDIASDQGHITLRAQLSTEVMPGVIVVPHGWGHQSTPSLTRAACMQGGNINQVIPGGASHMEPISGQAIMLGHAVNVSRSSMQSEKSESSEQLMAA